jgi:hypothetical protein
MQGCQLVLYCNRPRKRGFFYARLGQKQSAKLPVFTPKNGLGGRLGGHLGGHFECLEVVFCIGVALYSA